MNKKERPYVFCHMETSLDGKLMPDGKVWLRYLVEGKSAHDFSHDSEFRKVQEMLAKQVH